MPISRCLFGSKELMLLETSLTGCATLPFSSGLHPSEISMNSNSWPPWLVCEVSFAWQLQLVQCNVIEGLQAAYVHRYMQQSSPRPQGDHMCRQCAHERRPHMCSCALKAAVYRSWLLPARALCKALKAKVDESDVLQLLHHTWLAPQFSVSWLNRSLGYLYSKETEQVATILRKNRPTTGALVRNDRTRSASQPHHVHACTPAKKPRHTRIDTPSYYRQE
jgi:hypothetical protein